MDGLPFEVLEAIVSYLPLLDQKALALTCRKLYAVTTSPRFLAKRRYVLRDPIENTKFLFTDEKRLGEWCWLSRKKSSLEDPPSKAAILALLPLVTHWAHFLHHLSFKGYPPSSEQLENILQFCANLRSLDLSGCNSLFVPSAATGTHFCPFLCKAETRNRIAEIAGKQLRELCLAYMSVLNDEHFQHILVCFPGVVDLDLSGCLIDFSSFDGHYGSGGPPYSSPALSFGTVVSLLQKHSLDLQVSEGMKIRLNSTNINDGSLEALICAGIRLSGVFLDNCRNLSDYGITKMLAAQASLSCLRELSLGLPGPDVTSTSAAAILSKFGSHLVYLRLSNWPPPLNSALVSALSVCHDMRHFDLSSCLLAPAILSRVFVANLCSITSLNLSGHVQLSDADVEVIASHLRDRVRFLDISSCLGLSDRALATVTYYFSESLEVLIANWCKGFSDYGVLGGGLSECAGAGGIYSLRHLRDLNLSDCHRVTGCCFSTLSTVIHSGCLFNLASLRLGRIGELTKESFTNLVESAPLLQLLDISRSSIDDDTLNFLAAKLCNSLRELYIAGCENLTDYSLELLAEKIPFLRVLDVSFCPQISHESLSCFQEHMIYLSELKALYIGSAIPGRVRTLS